MDRMDRPNTEIHGRLRVDLFDYLAAQRKATTHDTRAALVGISRAHLIRIRNGESAISLDLAMRMARAVGTRVDELFAEAAEPAGVAR